MERAAGLPRTTDEHEWGCAQRSTASGTSFRRVLMNPRAALRGRSHSDRLLLLLSHSVISDSVQPWTAARHASLSLAISQSLLKRMSIESVMPSSHLILCHSLLLLPSIFSSIRVLSNDSVLRFRWPKYWSFSFSISPSNEYSGLISFRTDWSDLLAVQGAL